MKLLVATRSGGKQREIRRMLNLQGLELLFPDDAGVAESAAEDALEVHESFEGNARAKALYFAQRTGLPTVADDAGLEVFALGGAPGVRSKRWAGATGTEQEVAEANITALLTRLSGAPPERRRAQFRCVLAYYPTPTAVPQIFDGRAPGVILERRSGTQGFGYDPVFKSEALGMTFAESDGSAKDTVSHRGLAFAEFRRVLETAVSSAG